jgi:ketosteroid isomerase-like protein
MSENLNLVHSIYADWERGEFDSADWAHPEIEFTGVDGPDPAMATGRAGMAASFRDTLSAWKDFRVEAEEYRELDGGRVLVLDRLSGRGTTSGLELGQVRTTGAWLFHIRNGNVTRMVRYQERDRALADLGLEE